MEFEPKATPNVLIRAHRFDEQFEELKNEVDAWWRNGACKIEIEDDLGKMVRLFRLADVKPVPDKVPILVGESIHTLRSLLDNMVYGFVENAGESLPTRQTQFPICEARKDFSKACNSSLRGVPTNKIAQIERLQPFNSDGVKPHPLRLLRDLSNIDKHRYVIRAEAGHGTFIQYVGNCVNAPNKLTSGPLVEGQIIAEGILRDPAAGVNSSGRIVLAPSLFFGPDHDSASNLSVFKTLISIRDKIQMEVLENEQIWL